MKGEVMREVIREVEAYDGPEDLASHASKGMTPRNKVMFGPGGVWYVYLCYGTHWMLNAVTGDDGYPAAVLIRTVGKHDGPGKLTKALGIKSDLSGKSVAEVACGLWVEDAGTLVRDYEIIAKPRVGIGYAGPIWAAKPYRFCYEPGEKKPMRGVVGMKELGRGQSELPH
jgi:DNA-3-methyladenine glycosylase